MKPVAPIVFRYCTSELAHTAAPPSRFEPAALGCGLVLLCCIFSVMHTQSNCLICLPDKSGNFLAFGAKTRKNTEKSEKTGFGMAIIARPRPVFCVFGPKISRTFWGKCTEQSRREKLAEGGFEPETWFDSAHPHHKRLERKKGRNQALGGITVALPLITISPF